MSVVFREGQPNFPVDAPTLKTRLDEIEKLINNDAKVSHVNVKFVEKAFQLMQDCDLITETNLNNLRSAHYCSRVHPMFKFPFLPTEGALRPAKNNNDTKDDDGFPRFYSGKKRRVELGGNRYLISNDWYGDYSVCPNKRQFFNWLALRAINACQQHWAQNEQMPSNNSTPAKAPTVVPPQTAATVSPKTSTREDSLQMVIKSLEELHKKVDNLDKKIQLLGDDVHKELDEVKKEMNPLTEIWK